MIQAEKDKVYLYGLDETYKIVRWHYLPREYATVYAIRQTAKGLRSDYPSIQHVFAVDNSSMIYRAFKDIFRENSTANRVEFKMLLEQYGIAV